MAVAAEHVAVGMIVAAVMIVAAGMVTAAKMIAAAEIPTAGIITAEEIPTEGALRTGNPADRMIAAARKNGPAVTQATAAVTGTGTAARLPG